MILLNAKQMSPRWPQYPHERPDPVRVMGLGGHRLAYDPARMGLWELDPGETPPEPSAMHPQIPPAPLAQVQALCLCVSDACNLRCRYCYVSREVERAEWSRMDEMTAVRALDLLGAPRREFLVTFFGGEPLLAFRLMRFVVARAEKLADAAGVRARFHVTTNGTLLTDEILDFLEAHGFTMIVSLDGPPDLHDRHRCGSYEATRRGLDLVKTRPDLAARNVLRATFVPGEVEIAARLEHLNTMCDDGAASAVAVEPSVLSEQACGGSTLAGYARGEIARAMMDGARWCVARARQGKSARWRFLRVSMDRLAARKPQGTECGAGFGYLSVSPDGEVHACHKRVGKIGHVRWGLNECQRLPWRESRLYARERCPTCWARHVCGGGCRAHSVLDYGSPARPVPVVCETGRGRTLAAMWTLAELRDEPDAVKLLGPGRGKCGSDSSARRAG